MAKVDQAPLFVRVANALTTALLRAGVKLVGFKRTPMYLLTVRGRKSGQLRTVPIAILERDGKRYLTSPYGVVNWVRNLRAAGEGRLRVGRRLRTFHPTELADDEKVTILREYLRRWKWEVGVFFDGVGPDSTDDELRAVAPRHPVFTIAYAD